ncbi:MAG: hypothetical protein ACLPH3_02540 [Terracidiphilus sp.]
MNLLRRPLFVILFLAWLGAVTILPIMGKNVTWVAVTGLVMALSLVLMRHEEGVFDFKQMSISAAWFWTHIVFVVIPSLFVIYLESGNHPNRFMVSVDGSLILVPLGILIGHVICGSRMGAVRKYYLDPIDWQSADFTSLGVVALLVVCICVGYYHTTQVPSVPLLFMFQHPGETAATGLLREQSLKLLDSPLSYAYDVLAKVMFPVLVMMTGFRWLCLRTKWNRALFIATFVTALLYCGMTLERSPVGLAALGVVVGIYIIKRKGVLKSEAWLIPIAIFTFPTIVFIYEYANTTLQTGLSFFNATGGRIFYGGAQVLFYYFDLVPEAIPYQNGATIGKLALLLNLPKSPIANAVGLRIDPTLPQSVSANAPFLGTFYADWGMTGVMLGCIVTGIILAMVQHYIITRPKTLRNLCIYGFVLLKINVLALAALPYVLASGGVLIVMIPMFVEDLMGVRLGRTRGRRALFPQHAFPNPRRE